MFTSIYHLSSLIVSDIMHYGIAFVEKAGAVPYYISRLGPV